MVEVGSGIDEWWGGEWNRGVVEVGSGIDEWWGWGVE